MEFNENETYYENLFAQYRNIRKRRFSVKIFH